MAGISLTLAGGYAWAARPETYRDAVVEALDQRGVAYSGLEVREVCRPDPNCIIDLRTFATVVVYGDSASYGRVCGGSVADFSRGGRCIRLRPPRRAGRRHVESVGGNDFRQSCQHRGSRERKYYRVAGW